MENQEKQHEIFAAGGNENQSGNSSMAMDGPLRSGEQQQEEHDLDETDQAATSSAGGYGNDLDIDPNGDGLQDGDDNDLSGDGVNEDDDLDSDLDDDLSDDDDLDADTDLEDDELGSGSIDDDDDDLPDGNGLTERRGTDDEDDDNY
ncbi:hypothetical protein [Pedobacter sp. SYP-B3415]|uniref:hypothetical protein n=1 Tax=Pedobacter sp. SYP-B3415 TaxID=2496641 RepID=UPI00101D7964|nr:hypothetical protein [Pedobacter sp. SYP-B3415]